MTRLSVAWLLVWAATAGAAPVRLIARSIDYEGVTVDFPAITYRAPASSGGDPAQICAALASEAIGTPVDPVRDLVTVTEHRVVFKDPTDPGRLLKIYRPDHYDPDRIAKYLQRDLGVESYLRGLGLRVAEIDRRPPLIERGVLRQVKADGKSMADLYPRGYPAGADAKIDQALAVIARVDKPLIGINSRQSGVLLTNTVDCWHEIPVGVDVGHCRGNIFVLRGSGEPILIDW